MFALGVTAAFTVLAAFILLCVLAVGCDDKDENVKFVSGVSLTLLALVAIGVAIMHGIGFPP